MIVHKSTRVNVGGATPQEIIEALDVCLVPDKAVATGISFRWSAVELDDLFNSNNMALGDIGHELTFEWDDDE